LSKFCNQCGKSLTPNAKFCPGCGKSLAQNINLSPTSNNAIEHEHDDNLKKTLFVVPSYAFKNLENIFKRKKLQNIKILSIDSPGLAHDKVREYLNTNSTNIKYMCLIGNWDDLPPYRIPNPADTDFDQYCLNDSLYGSKEDFDNNPLNCIPEIIVGRIPIVEEVILENLLFSNFAFKKFNESFYFSISAECWLEATNAILFNVAQKNFANNLNPTFDKGSVDKGILSSPHWQENNLSQYFNNYQPEVNSLILFNVHGGADTPEWVGESNQREFIEIFKPGTISDYNYSLLLTESCYGGAMQYETDSIVENFFRNNGVSFIGSSTIAYGTPNDELCAADHIAQYFFENFDNGDSVGSALSKTKLQLLDENPIYQDITLKTIYSFNLFGVPWLSITNQPEKPQGSQSLLNSLRNNRHNNQAPSHAMLGSLREKYRSKLPKPLKQFWMEKDQALQNLSTFRDFQKIKNISSKCGISTEDLKMSELKNDISSGYKVVLNHKTEKFNKNLLIYTDKSGGLLKAFISK
jgi:hypothetical protein